MIDSVLDRKVSEIFSLDNAAKYAVPKYQRQYVWSKWNWDKLFTDFVENNEGYFIGSMICISGTDKEQSQQFEVVDGQQRITTISLLLAAFYSVLEEYKNDLDEDQRDTWRELKKRLTIGGKDLRVIPQITNQNLSDYNAVMTEVSIARNHKYTSNAGNRLILKAFRHFKKRLHEQIDEIESVPEKIEALFSTLTKVSGAVIVRILVKDYANAFTLFEAINNSGVPLNIIDLIKNIMMAKGCKDVDTTYSNWNEIIELLSDNYTIQERFFRQYYNTFIWKYRNDNNKSILPPLATRPKLISIYEYLIKENTRQLKQEDSEKETLLDELLAAAKLYAVLIGNSSDERYHPLKKSMEKLSRIEGAPSYILLLYLLSYHDKLNLSEKKLNGIVEYIAQFFVIRNLTDVPRTNALQNIFMEIVGYIEQQRITLPFESIGEISEKVIKEKLFSVINENTFLERITGPLYNENTALTRFVLSYIQEDHFTDETHKNLWEYDDKNKLAWTIEHIFPEGQENGVPKKEYWIKMIADGNIGLAKEYYAKYVHCLGNLTLTGFNSNLSDSEFHVKRNKKDDKGNPIGYKNGLWLNADVADKTEWTIDEIEKRHEKLVLETIRLFTISEDKEPLKAKAKALIKAMKSIDSTIEEELHNNARNY